MYGPLTLHVGLKQSNRRQTDTVTMINAISEQMITTIRRRAPGAGAVPAPRLHAAPPPLAQHPSLRQTSSPCDQPAEMPTEASRVASSVAAQAVGSPAPIERFCKTKCTSVERVECSAQHTYDFCYCYQSHTMPAMCSALQEDIIKFKLGALVIANCHAWTTIFLSNSLLWSEPLPDYAVCSYTLP